MIVRCRVRARIDPYMLVKPCRSAERKAAVQAEKDTRPFVPKRTGSLVNRAEVLNNLIIYHGPYARTMYFGRQLIEPKTGVPGFPVGGREFRSHRGVTKVLSRKKLSYTNGQDYWFSASKRKNIGNWLRAAEKEAKRHGRK